MKSARATYEVALATVQVECPGIPTPVRGLALVDVSQWAGRDQVSVTHVRSGAMVAAFGSAEAAVEMVIWLGEQPIDWTASGDDLRRTYEAGFAAALEGTKARLGARSGAVGSADVMRRAFSR